MTGVDQISVSHRGGAQFADRRVTTGKLTMSVPVNSLSGAVFANHSRQCMANRWNTAAGSGVGDPGSTARGGAPTDHHGLRHAGVAAAPAGAPIRLGALLARSVTAGDSAQRQQIGTRGLGPSRHTRVGIGRPSDRCDPGTPWSVPTAASGASDDPGRTDTRTPGRGVIVPPNCPGPWRVEGRGRRGGALAWRCCGGILDATRLRFGAGACLIAVGRVSVLEHGARRTGRTATCDRRLERLGANHTNPLHAVSTATVNAAALQSA